MIFKEYYKKVYCDEEHYKNHDNHDFEIFDNKLYYKGYLVHRVDGPVIIHEYGTEWYKKGKCHREDGPAVESNDGVYRGWYLNVNYYEEEEYNRIINIKNKRDILNEI